MTTPEDRVLEHALEQHFQAPTDDLSYRVLARLGQAEQAPDTPPKRNWLRPLVVATAAAALVTFAVLRFGNRPPVAIATNTSGEVQELFPGDPLAVAPGDPSVVARIGSATLRVAPGTVLAFDSVRGVPTCAVLYGSVFADHSGQGQLRLATQGMTTTLTDACRIDASVHVQVQGEEPMTDFESITRCVLGRLVPLQCVLALTVIDGTASCQQQGEVTRLAAGTTRTVTWQQEQGKYGKHKTESSRDTKVDEHELMLRRQIGTWDIEVTATHPRTGETKTLRGSSVAKPGPGAGWVVSDLLIKQGYGKGAHLVIGYDAKKKTYVGTLIEGQSKDIVVMRGKAGDDPKRFTLAAETADGDWKNGRIVLEWKSDSVRVLRFEQKVRRSNEWKSIAEMKFTRRPVKR